MEERATLVLVAWGEEWRREGEGGGGGGLRWKEKEGMAREGVSH